MAAFTLAAGLALGYAASKLKKGTKPPVSAPAPITDPASMVQPPAPPMVSPGADQAAAVQAGAKQRKKAALGQLANRPVGTKKPGTALAELKPKALMGSSY